MKSRGELNMIANKREKAESKINNKTSIIVYQVQMKTKDLSAKKLGILYMIIRSFLILIRFLRLYNSHSNQKTRRLNLRNTNSFLKENFPNSILFRKSKLKIPAKEAKVINRVNKKLSRFNINSFLMSSKLKNLSKVCLELRKILNLKSKKNIAKLLKK